MSKIEDLHNISRIPTEAEIEREANTPGIFGRIFRVAKVERTKFVCLATMYYLIALSYSLIKDLKNSIMIETQGNAAIAPFQLFFVTPCIIICVSHIQKALSKYTISQVLSKVMFIFIIFFFFYGVFIIRYGYVLEPNRFWACDNFGEGKLAIRNIEFLYPNLMTINTWTTALSYLSSELYGGLVLSLLFLSYSNHICAPKQSLRFTPLYFMASNFGLITSGCATYIIAGFKDTQSYKFNLFVLQFIFIFISLCCFVVFILHKFIENNILNKPLYIIENEQTKKKKTEKIDSIKGLRIMLKSKLILAMSATVFLFFLSACMCDTCYCSAMQVLSIKTNKPASFVVLKRAAMSQLSIGCCLLLFLFAPTAILIEKGYFTFIGGIPIFIVGFLGTCILVLAFLNKSVAFDSKNDNFLSNFIKSIGYHTNLDLETKVGWFSTALFKLSKDGALDICKEALSVKINVKYRATAKNIYDGIVGKIGRMVGSLLFILLYAIYDTKDARDTVNVLLIIHLTGVIILIFCMLYLGRKYNESMNNNSDIDLGFK
ncbi:ADP,ATP carrier protein 1 [Astathelohania contejeani]|uniref:ADP,ATP carrier protein n=1 Tax=Astathelohania contejeani TaxID=164912 RepID=A0ABQ7HWQ8_9MICR|nr:ADP,ATP carrier protein 1 [Thelohania contejeani]